MTWVPVFDQSFQRVPASRLHEMYTAGYRVMAGYAGGGSSSKWLTQHEIDVWLALGPDTGVAALFEIVGDEPITSPSSGTAHARAARAAWRALGYPDHCGISPAMDRDVSMEQARAQLARYFGAWKAADTARPIPYVEADAGSYLFSAGISSGTFTPAAWGWNSPAVLYTPANAPDHVIWTQEHNGRSLAGGDVDTGHIRTSAPIWWRTPSKTGEDDMPLTDADVTKIVAGVDAWFRKDGVVPPSAILAQPKGPRDPANTNGWSILSLLTEPANRDYQFQQGLVTTLAGQIAAVIAPKVTGMSQEQIQQAVAAELSTLTLTAQPPAGS